MSSNVFGLSGLAERTLLALSLKYELTAGTRVNWRKNPFEVVEMIQKALASRDIELLSKAHEFLDSLPNAVLDKLAEFGLDYDRQTKPIAPRANLTMTYRGAYNVMPRNTPEACNDSAPQRQELSTSAYGEAPDTHRMQPKKTKG